MSPVTVAAVQAAPEFLDRDATIGKVVALAEKAASRGARLVAFPEAFVPGYPDWVWRTRPWDATATVLYARLLEQAVVADSPACDALAKAARRLGIWLSVGATERDQTGSTLYNALLHFAPDGTLAGRHRKLMPSGGERLVWGAGDGSGLAAIDAGFGRLGGLICWENYMPLARSALYAQGIDIYLAPTWDNSEVWIPTLRHIAKEGRTYVVGVTACIRATDLPGDLPGRADLYGGAEDWLSRGNSAVIAPGGDIIAGPLTGEAGIVCAEIDTEVARAARQQFDPVGHYSRSDVLRLTVDAAPRAAVRFRRDDAGVPARPSAGSTALVLRGSANPRPAGIPARRRQVSAMTTLRIAAVQASYVLMDRDATIGKVAALTAAAAARGAQLIVFPEVFVPGTPIWIDTQPIWKGDEDWFALLADNAVVIPGRASEHLAAIAAEHQVWLVIGVQEREPHGSTIYNTVLYFSPLGELAGRHRKLVPTGSERTVWGMGDGSTLRVIDTGLARIGGLICWENYMPLARFHLYAQGVQVWLAPTLASGDGWIATMRHIARENRMFVVGVNPVLHADQVPAGFPGRDRLIPAGYLDDNGPWLEEGNTVVVAPSGTVLAGPVRQREETLIADLGLRDVTVARRHLDPAGHYNRPDIFRLQVNTSPRPAVIESGTIAAISQLNGGSDEHASDERARA